MSLGNNIRFLRGMRSEMTQEDLAERLSVSRQTVSKWESGESIPAMEKLFDLCDFFSCTLDQLLRSDLTGLGDAYSEIRIVKQDRFRIARHAIISATPEDDALLVIRTWAEKSGLNALPDHKQDVIGWDFPVLSQEQINVFNMHGYVSACVIPADFAPKCDGAELVWQEGGKYAAITITEPFKAAFTLIPNAYKTILDYLREKNIPMREESQTQSFCFERVYVKNSVEFMDVFIALA